MIVYVTNPRESKTATITKPPGPNSKYSKVSGNKVNTQKLISFINIKKGQLWTI